MTELTIRSADEQQNTIASDIGEAGIHIFTDRGFFDRIKAIKVAFDGYLTEDEINSLGLSPKRALILRQAMRKISSAWYQFAFGKAGEKPKLGSAFAAAREMVLLVEECVESDASDDEVWLICRERLSYIDIPVLYTFDSQNTTVNKAFTVQGIPQPGLQQPTMTPLQQVNPNSEKPERGGKEYAGRNPP